MTTNRLSRLRNLLNRNSLDSVREQILVPVAANVTSFADIGGPTAAGGWIEADDHPTLFERDPEAMEQELTELWRRHGRDELLPLAGPVAQLAEKARKEPLTTERDVSSTVYAMQ